MINKELAQERGLTQESIDAIEVIHEKLYKYLESARVGNYVHAMLQTIEDLEFELQGLWGFPLDSDYHTWTRRYEFKCQWVGRVFQCAVTGETFIIPDDVYETACYFFGNGAMVDVGRLGLYSRFSGIKEITKTHKGEAK